MSRSFSVSNNNLGKNLTVINLLNNRDKMDKDNKLGITMSSSLQTALNSFDKCHGCPSTKQYLQNFNFNK